MQRFCHLKLIILALSCSTTIANELPIIYGKMSEKTAEQIAFEQKTRKNLQQKSLINRWQSLEADIKQNKMENSSERKYLRESKKNIELDLKYLAKLSLEPESEYNNLRKAELQNLINFKKIQIDDFALLNAKYHKERKDWIANTTAILKEEKEQAREIQYWYENNKERDKQYDPQLKEVLARDKNAWLYQVEQPYLSEITSSPSFPVHIGIIDHGFTINHPQLKDKISETFNAYYPGKSMDRKDYDHGTMVATLAAGKLSLLQPLAFNEYRDLYCRKLQYTKTGCPSYDNTDGANFFQGVAPNAKLVLVDPHGGSNTWLLKESFSWLATKDEVSVVNFSADINSVFREEDREFLEKMLKSGPQQKLLVVSSGNHSLYEPLWPGLYAKENWANGQIIIVGGVDRKNQILDFSSVPGPQFAPYFLVAPADEISTGGIGGGYKASISGTSFATALVSGAAALIKSKWPHLSASDTARIILDTATPLISKNTSNDYADNNLNDIKLSDNINADPIYGRGLLNIRKALSPIGQLRVKTHDGYDIAVDQASFNSLNGAMAGGLLEAANGGQLTIDCALDDYNRCYSLELYKKQNTPRKQNKNNGSNNFLNRVKYINQIKYKSLDDNLSYIQYSIDKPNLIHQSNFLLSKPQFTTNILRSVAIVLHSNNKNTFSINIGQESTLNIATLNNAYAELISNPSGFTFAHKFSAVSLKFGFSANLGSNIFGANNFNMDDFNINRFDTNSINFTNKKNIDSLSTIELSKNWQNNFMSLSFGRLAEYNSLLGTKSPSALLNFNSDNHDNSVDDKSSLRSINTQVITFSMAYKLNQKLIATAYIARGFSIAYNNKHSLISRVSNIHSHAYGVGFVMNDIWKAADRLAFNISIPLRVTSGSMQLDYLKAITANGEHIRAQKMINLKSPAHEYLAQFSYLSNFSKKSQLSMAIGYQRKISNLSDISGASSWLNEMSANINFSLKI